MMKLEFNSQYIICNGKEYDRLLIEKIINQASDPSTRNVVIDGFCGFGGVTAGFSQLSGWKVIACINHWDVAIATHQKNYPDCLHLLEDFRFADIAIIQYMLDEIRLRNPNVKVHGWFSLECTNFSNAKGGQSRNADSRTLADYLDRYVIALSPDVIWIENVKEFLMWGPMIPKVVQPNGKKKKTIQFNPRTDDDSIFINTGAYCPLIVDKKTKERDAWMIPGKAHMGEDFRRWKKYIISFGYDKNVGQKLLNCADYGIPQHRVRLIMQFNREGVDPVYPSSTHDKKGRNGLPKWNPVKPCLDLEDEGEEVLSFKVRKSGPRKGELIPRIKSPKTIARLINGCNKHVINGEKGKSWIVKPNSAKNNTDVSAGSSINEIAPTLTCYNGFNVAKVNLIDHYFGNGYMKPVSEPIGTTGTKDGAALHTLQFLGTGFGRGNGSNLESPSPSIMPGGGGKYPVVTVDKFIMDTQFNNGPKDLNKPSGTITANRKHYYLVNFQWFAANLKTLDNPSNTIIARQDKAPNYLITLETGELAIEVFEHDPPHYVKMKKYMAENGIIGIKMRMLNEIEMLKIMTIPETTKLSRSSTDNKKMIGNAVPSELVMCLGRAYDGETELMQKVA
jgi:DNA (cytosine-5)-methyltransferase 1